jgi:L-threonylcarbamoyladenylate synthase
MRIAKKIKTDEIVSLLKKGGVVVLPTDTAYGFSCDFKNKKAIQKIYNIKGRPEHKPFLFMASDLKMAEEFFVLSPEEKKLAKNHWPGPLSIILSTKKGLAHRATAEGGKGVGVRVPDDNLCRKIIKKLGRPIVTTSANISGKETPYSIPEILKQFGNEDFADLVVDAGKLKKVKPSTLIKIEKGKVVVLRQGPVKI